MNAKAQLRRLLSESIVLEGGEETDWYLDAPRATFGYPSLVSAAIAEAMDEAEIVEHHGRIRIPDAFGGPADGAIPIATSLCMRMDAHSFAVRKPETHGLDPRYRLVGMLSPGDVTIMVADVVTTGKSLLDAVSVAHELGADIVAAVCLLNRGKPAHRLALPWHDHSSEDPSVPFISLFTPADLGVQE